MRRGRLLENDDAGIRTPEREQALVFRGQGFASGLGRQRGDDAPQGGDVAVAPLIDHALAFAR